MINETKPADDEFIQYLERDAFETLSRRFALELLARIRADAKHIHAAEVRCAQMSDSIVKMAKAMKEAVENCETCRGQINGCARCATFGNVCNEIDATLSVPDEEYPMPEESVITNTAYAAQKARIIELGRHVENWQAIAHDLAGLAGEYKFDCAMNAEAIGIIRNILEKADVPVAAFVEDHVCNAIIQRNEARNELARLANIAGEAIGTDPSLRNSACVDVLVSRVEMLRRELAEERDVSIAHIAELAARLAIAEIDKCNAIERTDKLRQAMGEIHTLIGSLPSGIDYEANPDNASPADAVAFVGGLIWQICERVR